MDVLIRLSTSEIDFASSESDIWPKSEASDCWFEREIFLTFLGDIMGTTKGDGLRRKEVATGAVATAEVFKYVVPGDSIVTSTRRLVVGVRGAGRGIDFTGENDSPFKDGSFPIEFAGVLARDGVKL